MVPYHCHAVDIKNLGARQIQNRLQNKIPPEVKNLPKGILSLTKRKNIVNKNLISTVLKVENIERGDSL